MCPGAATGAAAFEAPAPLLSGIQIGGPPPASALGIVPPPALTFRLACGHLQSRFFKFVFQKSMERFVLVGLGI